MYHVPSAKKSNIRYRTWIPNVIGMMENLFWYVPQLFFPIGSPMESIARVRIKYTWCKQLNLACLISSALQLYRFADNPCGNLPENHGRPRGITKNRCSASVWSVSLYLSLLLLSPSLFVLYILRIARIIFCKYTYFPYLHRYIP